MLMYCLVHISFKETGWERTDQITKEISSQPIHLSNPNPCVILSFQAPAL